MPSEGGCLVDLLDGRSPVPLLERGPNANANADAEKGPNAAPNANMPRRP